MTPFDPRTAAKILDLMAEGAGLGRAAPIAGVPARAVSEWRQRGWAMGHGELYDFDREATRIEADLVAEAERTLRRVMSSPTENRGGRNAPKLSAAKWLLERKLPEEYGDKTFAVKVRQEMALELLDHLRERLSAEHYGRVLDALESRETAKRLAKG